jgi:hypothetical protein
MATIVITIILNLFIGTPSETDTDQTATSTTTTTGDMTTMGGSGAWTNVDK